VSPMDLICVVAAARGRGGGTVVIGAAVGITQQPIGGEHLSQLAVANGR
jgi:hypothetical protein